VPVTVLPPVTSWTCPLAGAPPEVTETVTAGARP
jgi:hypothetical protein